MVMGGTSWEGPEGSFWGTGNVPLLEVGESDMWVYTLNVKIIVLYT